LIENLIELLKLLSFHKSLLLNFFLIKVFTRKKLLRYLKM